MSLQSHTALSLTAHKLASSTAQRGLHGRPLTCCLQALTSRHGSAVSPTTLAAALQEVVPLLSDGDLLIAALSLNFCGSLVRAQPPWGPGSSGTGAAAHPGVDQKSPPAGGAPLPQICGAAWNLPAQACRLQVSTAPEEQACRPHVPHSRQRPAPLRFYAILSVLGRLA